MVVGLLCLFTFVVFVSVFVCVCLFGRACFVCFVVVICLRVVCVVVDCVLCCYCWCGAIVL